MARPTDCFEVLGLSHTADEDEIRRAWRTRAKRSHPDSGGDPEDMVRLNRALEEALTSLRLADDPPVVHSGVRSGVRSGSGQRRLRDAPSFTIDVLPVEAFELLAMVGATLGSVIEEEPPYLIEFTLESSGAFEGVGRWCRCEVYPEAGSSSVHLTVGGDGRLDDDAVLALRDEMVRTINDLSI